MTEKPLAQRPPASLTPEELWQQYEGCVRHVAAQMVLTLGNEYVSKEEFMQCGYETLHRAAQLFDPGRKVKFITYLYRGLRWNMRRYFNHQKREYIPQALHGRGEPYGYVNSLDIPAIEASPAEENRTAAAHLFGSGAYHPPLQEQALILQQAQEYLLRELPDPIPELFQRYYRDGLHRGEIAEERGISPSRVGQQLDPVRQRLRQWQIAHQE